MLGLLFVSLASYNDLCTTETTSTTGSDKTDLATSGCISSDSRSFTNMLMVTTTMGMLNGVHGNFCAAKVEKTLAVHVVGSKNQLEKRSLWKFVDESSIPGIFDNFFHFHTTDWFCDFCRLFSFMMLKIIANERQSCSIDLFHLNFSCICISFKNILNKLTLSSVFFLNFDPLWIFTRAD